MLDKFKKLLGAAPEAEAVVEAPVVEAQAVETALADDMQAKLAQLTVDIEVAAGALATMTANYEAAQGIINALTAEKAEAQAKADVAKFAARKEKVVAAIGTEKADGLMLATAGLDDAAFNAVVSALAGSVAVEASSKLFSEVGVAAEADAAKVVEESKEMALIKQRYHNTK